MKITNIEIERTKNLGNFENKKVKLSVVLEDGDDFHTSYQALEKELESLLTVHGAILKEAQPEVVKEEPKEIPVITTPQGAAKTETLASTLNHLVETPKVNIMPPADTMVTLIARENNFAAHTAKSPVLKALCNIDIFEETEPTGKVVKSKRITCKAGDANTVVNEILRLHPIFDNIRRQETEAKGKKFYPWDIKIFRQIAPGSETQVWPK